MNFLKYFYVMSFVPLAMLNNSIAKEYYLNRIYPLFRELIERSVYSNYSKHYIDKTLMQIVNELSLLLKEYDLMLSKSEKNYIKGLGNLTKQFKRYAREKSSATYPLAISALTTDDLQQFISNLSQTKGIRPEIIFFIDPLYQSLYNITNEKALTYNNLKYNELIKQEVVHMDINSELNVNFKENNRSEEQTSEL